MKYKSSCFLHQVNKHLHHFSFVARSCSNYYVLEGFDRNVANTDQKNLRCDQRNLSPYHDYWYRFKGAAGIRMPTFCVPTRRCGTHAPGWLNGSHPSVREGVVTRRVCYHWGSNCCNWENDIQIQNCGAFYVYRLVKPPQCYLRYCAYNQSKFFLCVLSICYPKSSCTFYFNWNCTLILLVLLHFLPS